MRAMRPTGFRAPTNMQAVPPHKVEPVQTISTLSAHPEHLKPEITMAPAHPVATSPDKATTAR